MKHLTTPITDDDLNNLNVGDKITISGTIYTGRDAALPQLVKLLEKNEVPFDTQGMVIMHTAFSDAGIAPTTSNKEEIESTIPYLSENGVKIHIGKGMLNDETAKSLNENNSISVKQHPNECGIRKIVWSRSKGLVMYEFNNGQKYFLLNDSNNKTK